MNKDTEVLGLTTGTVKLHLDGDEECAVQGGEGKGKQRGGNIKTRARVVQKECLRHWRHPSDHSGWLGADCEATSGRDLRPGVRESPSTDARHDQGPRGSSVKSGRKVDPCSEAGGQPPNWA